MVLPNGLRYQDLKIGGGSPPIPGEHTWTIEGVELWLQRRMLETGRQVPRAVGLAWHAVEHAAVLGLAEHSVQPHSPCPPLCLPAGYIVVVDYKAYANGQLFEDTMARGKPIVFLYGKRPFSGGMCLGVEQALATMRAGAPALSCAVVCPCCWPEGYTGLMYAAG